MSNIPKCRCGHEAEEVTRAGNFVVIRCTVCSRESKQFHKSPELAREDWKNNHAEGTQDAHIS